MSRYIPIALSIALFIFSAPLHAQDVVVDVKTTAEAQDTGNNDNDVTPVEVTTKVQVTGAEADPSVLVVPDESARDVVIVPAGPSAAELGLPLSLRADNVSHADLIITPDRSEILRLDREAGSVIIGNPQHLNVLAENSKMLVLVPRMEGATHITILDKNGDVIMQRHVIVGATQERYVRVRKSCAASNDSACESTQVYYCPGSCHKIGMPEKSGDAPTSAAPEGAEVNTQGRASSAGTSPAGDGSQ